MKYFYLLVLLVVLTVELSAQQTLANSSDLSVLKKKWSMKLRTDAASLLNPDPKDDPFQANNEAAQAIKDQKDYLCEKKIREKGGEQIEGPKNRVKSLEKNYRTDDFSTRYTYQIKVQNNGSKTIQKVDWEYIFLSVDDNNEVGRLKFESKTNLKPQQTDTLSEEIISPPTRSINVNDAEKKSSDLYIEQIVIKSIHYTDGSVWQSDPK